MQLELFAQSTQSIWLPPGDQVRSTCWLTRAQRIVDLLWSYGAKKMLVFNFSGVENGFVARNVIKVLVNGKNNYGFINHPTKEGTYIIDLSDIEDKINEVRIYCWNKGV